MFPDADRLDRDQLIRAVLERNPTLEAARQGWQAVLHQEPQVASLDDPTLSYSVAPLSIGTRDVRYGQVIQFSQRLPYPGKLRLKGEIARAEAEWARHDYEAVRLQLAVVASFLFDDYYFVHRALGINGEHLRLLEDFQRIATVRYTSGLAGQQDPLQAEVEVAHLLHRDVVLQTRRQTIGAQMNALLHRPPEARLPPPPSELGVPAAEELDPMRLQNVALAERPDLQGRLAEIQARKAKTRLRQRDVYPDFEAMTSFNSMWSDSDHRWMVGIGINLPIYRDRIQAALAEATAALRRAEQERAALEDVIRTELYVARAQWLEAQHVVELYRSRLLPASRDQIRAARAGFETGQNSFLALIEAERNQRSVELGYEEALTDLYRRRAELDRARGRIPVFFPSEESEVGKRGQPGVNSAEGGVK